MTDSARFKATKVFPSAGTLLVTNRRFKDWAAAIWYSLDRNVLNFSAPARFNASSAKTENRTSVFHSIFRHLDTSRSNSVSGATPLGAATTLASGVWRTGPGART